jgi:hypothetical protein
MRTLYADSCGRTRARRTGPADKTFTDPAGDSGAAHDVTSFVVSNDATQVVLRFPGAEIRGRISNSRRIRRGSSWSTRTRPVDG